MSDDYFIFINDTLSMRAIDLILDYHPLVECLMRVNGIRHIKSGGKNYG